MILTRREIIKMAVEAAFEQAIEGQSGSSYEEQIENVINDVCEQVAEYESS